MQFDQPILDAKDDKFERTGYAQALSNLLLLPSGSPSFTLAVEGAWGIGKTSVINLIKSELEAHESKPIIIEFNPWLIGSLDSVVEGFLIQFATSINRVPNSDTAKNASLKLLQFAQFLAPIKLIPGVEPWGSILEKTLFSVGEGVKTASNLDKFDLVKRKNQLQDTITQLDKQIIVIIDDIDRLPPEEVRIVFRLFNAYVR
jgi:predicted KAP-like P-loop ATPase